MSPRIAGKPDPKIKDSYREGEYSEGRRLADYARVGCGTEAALPRVRRAGSSGVDQVGGGMAERLAGTRELAE